MSPVKEGMTRLVVFVLTAVASAGEPKHWAYEPPIAADVPAEAHPVDYLLTKSRRQAGVEAAPLAKARDQAERAAISLTGLPPTPAQVARVEAGDWETLLDELMASPAYGERWARHWMDVARYSDTMGYNFDRENRYPYAWTYRDWLIRAFNEDLPWDRFIKLQIAADLIVDRPDHPDLAALGFLTVGPTGRRDEIVDDRVDVITRGFMGTTVSCARCHDHKTDPIPTEDYYSIYSILENANPVGRGPVIGEPANETEHRDFQKKKATLEERDLAARQALWDDQRERLAVYLELAWRAENEHWDNARIGAEGFKHGRARGGAIRKWRDFLKANSGDERIMTWTSAMAAASADREALCAKFAIDWNPDGSLEELAKHPACPLSHDVEGVRKFFDGQDHRKQAERAAELVKLEADHAGAPPRAMVVKDRKSFVPARVMRRGNPSDLGEPFEPQWLSVLGGGGFTKGKGPRLSLAEKITDPANPLTARVIVNRVWAWHFGSPLADPGDFGPQQDAPRQLELLDHLAVWFTENGGSLKKLHKLLLSSDAFRLAADGPTANDRLDEANETFWKWNRRRLDFEAMRDGLLSSAGTLDPAKRGGRSVDLETADAWRSVYGRIDRYELPGLLVNFDLPHPDHHAPRRIETTVPQQALWFLNGGLPVRQAAKLAADAEFLRQPDAEAKTRWLYQRVLGREADEEEVATIRQWIQTADLKNYERPLAVEWKLGYAEDHGVPPREIERFPLFADGVWKTGPELATAPVRWLSAGKSGAHASATHSLVLRWQAQGPGEIRLVGRMWRKQTQGARLLWQIVGPNGAVLKDDWLVYDGSSKFSGPWIGVATGDTMDLVIRAPEGEGYGSMNWDLRVEGRDDDGELQELLKQNDFPVNGVTRELPPTGNPWSDVIQMLWASNEFIYLD